MTIGSNLKGQCIMKVIRVNKDQQYRLGQFRVALLAICERLLYNFKTYFSIFLEMIFSLALSFHITSV
jgi:hypothetical protein